MRYRTLVQTTASVVIAVFAVGIWSMGDAVKFEWLRFFSAAVLLSTLTLNLGDRWLWRLPLSQRIRSVPRDIRGTWRGTLTSLWEDPSTRQRPEPKAVYLVVRQTASTVSARLFTNELKSHSTFGKVQTIAGEARLDYFYIGEPNPSVESRSRMHRGSTTLDILGIRASRLKGRYWTDRDSKGELDFNQRHEALAESYEEAATLFHTVGQS